MIETEKVDRYAGNQVHMNSHALDIVSRLEASFDFREPRREPTSLGSVARVLRGGGDSTRGTEAGRLLAGLCLPLLEEEEERDEIEDREKGREKENLLGCLGLAGREWPPSVSEANRRGVCGE